MQINYAVLAAFAAARPISYNDLCVAVRECLAVEASVAPEQEPVGQWSDDGGLTWCDGSEQELASARAAGWMTRHLYKLGSYGANQEPVAEVRYMGYEPTNHLNWLGKNNLQLLPDGTKLYTHADPSEVEQMREELNGIKNINGEIFKALKNLTMHARTSGGTAGPDAGLMEACSQAEKMLSLGGIGRAYMEGADALETATHRADAAERKLGDLKALADIWDQNAAESDDFGNALGAEALRFAAHELRGALLSASAEPASKACDSCHGLGTAFTDYCEKCESAKGGDGETV